MERGFTDASRYANATVHDVVGLTHRVGSRRLPPMLKQQFHDTESQMKFRAQSCARAGLGSRHGDPSARHLERGAGDEGRAPGGAADRGRDRRDGRAELRPPPPAGDARPDAGPASWPSGRPRTAGCASARASPTRALIAELARPAARASRSPRAPSARRRSATAARSAATSAPRRRPATRLPPLFAVRRRGRARVDARHAPRARSTSSSPARSATCSRPTS